MLIQNKFISFEGIDGCGKSTQSKMLEDWFLSRQQRAIWTREPGGANAAEQIRAVVVNNQLSNISELFLMMAARKEHIDKIINPGLQNDYFVVCDRYIDSTVAYQASESLSIDEILDLHKKYMEDLMPVMTFYIKVSYEVAVERISLRLGNDRFDELGRGFFSKLELHYEILSKKFKERIFTIDGSREAAAVHDTIKAIVLDYYFK